MFPAGSRSFLPRITHARRSPSPAAIFLRDHEGGGGEHRTSRQELRQNGASVGRVVRSAGGSGGRGDPEKRLLLRGEPQDV